MSLAKDRLVKSLKSFVLEKIEVPISAHNESDKIDLENEIGDILTNYDFDKQQVLDITELMFNRYTKELSLYDDAFNMTNVETSNGFGQCYHDFIVYYVSGYVADFLTEEVEND